MAATVPDVGAFGELCRKLEMDVAKLSGVLTVLEVKGFVRRFPGMYYAARAEQE